MNSNTYSYDKNGMGCVNEGRRCTFPPVSASFTVLSKTLKGSFFKPEKGLHMKKSLLFVFVIIVSAVAVGVGAWTMKGSPAYGLAEFSVDNMTCGSCAGNIRKALAPIGGVGEVDVSVTAGRARVEYDPQKLRPEALADKITAAGYPAQVGQVLSADEYRRFREDRNQLAEKFIARIGERLISREAFAQAVSDREGDPNVVRLGLLRATWEELLQRELLLSAAEKNGVVVQDGEIELEYQKMRNDTEGFDALIAARYGNEEAYKGLLKENLIINRNIDEYVLKGENDNTQRRLKLNRWFNDLVNNTPVTIFDPALRKAVEGGGSGCGGSCCG